MSERDQEQSTFANALERVLVVDAEPAIRSAVAYYLSHGGEPTIAVANGAEALERLAEGGTFLVVTELSPPDMPGLELLSRIRAAHPDVDVIFTTSSADSSLAMGAIREGAFDFYRKPYELDELALGVRRARERRNLIRRALEAEKAAERSRLTEAHVRETIATIAAMIDAKSRFTRSHSERVASYSARLAAAFGLDEESVQRVRFGGRIHDIGKIGTPDAILEKPAPLTNEEWVIMRKHPTIGGDCLRGMGSLQPYLSMVELHHESWDGSGYPYGLRGQDTPLEARIVKIADYYDAITSRRPYRQPMALAKAIEDLRAGSGRLFDPELTELFIEICPQRVLGDRARRAQQDFGMAESRNGP